MQQLEGKLLEKEKEKEELATSFSAEFNSVIEKEREHFRVELTKQVINNNKVFVMNFI